MARADQMCLRGAACRARSIQIILALVVFQCPTEYLLRRSTDLNLPQIYLDEYSTTDAINMSRFSLIPVFFKANCSSQKGD